MLFVMRLSNDFTLDFTNFPKEVESCELQLGDDFFAHFEDGEISGGDVDLILSVSPLDADRLQLSFDYVGEVRVECDRCLLPMPIEVDAEESVDVVLGESLNDVDDEEDFEYSESYFDDLETTDYVRGEDYLDKAIYSKKTVVITAAQNNTPVEVGFLKCLQSYVKERDAGLVVIPIKYKTINS